MSNVSDVRQTHSKSGHFSHASPTAHTTCSRVTYCRLLLRVGEHGRGRARTGQGGDPPPPPGRSAGPPPGLSAITSLRPVDSAHARRWVPYRRFLGRGWRIQGLGPREATLGSQLGCSQRRPCRRTGGLRRARAIIHRLFPQLPGFGWGACQPLWCRLRGCVRG